MKVISFQFKLKYLINDNRLLPRELGLENTPIASEEEKEPSPHLNGCPEYDSKLHLIVMLLFWV